MNKGFTLIELMVSLLLASLVSLSLFQLLRQVRRGVVRITNVIEVDMPLAGFYNQVEKDVTGMFTPHSTLKVFTQADGRKEPKKERQKSSGTQKKTEELSKPIENIYVSVVQGTDFFWSFITTGGIQVLDADGNITPVPFVRRVAYLLEKDPRRPGTFRLMYRFSGTQLELEPFKSANFTPSYELLSGIKQLVLEVSVLALIDQEKKQQPDEEAEKKEGKEEGARKATVTPSRAIALSSWDPQAIWDTYKTLIPAYVKLSGIRVDTAGIEYPFEVVAKVYAYSPFVEKEKSLFEALEDIARKIWKKT